MKPSKLERTHTCGGISEKDIGTSVLLKGWVHRRRDHGGVIFIDLRDRYGMTQVVFRPEENPIAHKLAEEVRSEFVLALAGKVSARPDGMINPNIPTGAIEVIGEAVEILARAQTTPFPLNEDAEVTEALRLKYRYLDLRRRPLQEKLEIRHKIAKCIHHYMDSKGFIEVETPILTKSTPEGARDYLVPSRVHPGKFFALPQSPQLFKQLLMISGLDRYYQIVRCFRDEDLRADRQPEFTQLDLELSFATPEIIYREMEGLFTKIFQEVMGLPLKTPFLRMTYADAISRYGSDKPDLRWPIEMKDLSHLFSETGFRVFQSALDQGGEIRGFRLPGGDQISRNQFDQLVDKVKGYGAKGLVWMRKRPEGLSSSIDKFISPDELQKTGDILDLQIGDMALIIADKPNVARAALNSLRLHCVERLQIQPTSPFAFLWVTDFPLYDYSDEDQRFVSMHHPFTMPAQEDIPLVMQGKGLENVRAMAYDLVLNGFEIGGGSIRIHDSEIQNAVFQNLGLSEKEAREKFGFFLEALTYGTPPHGGIAFGLDRIAMILSGTQAIRDVIAFPKTQNALDLMCDAPSFVSVEQLTELHLRSTSKSNEH